jgi:hypothetical protein
MERQLLEKPFPEGLIKSRRGLNGKVFSYVEGAEYIKRLNEVFEGNWSFEVVEHQVHASEVIVLGRLTANGVVKSSFGGSSISIAKDTGERVSIADDLKAAATDALKKTCSLLGIGLHLYSDSDDKSRDVRKPTQEEAPSHHQPTNSASRKLTPKQLSAIWSMTRSLGMNTDDVRRKVAMSYSCALEELPRQDASHFISLLAAELNSARGVA